MVSEPPERGVLCEVDFDAALRLCTVGLEPGLAEAAKDQFAELQSCLQELEENDQAITDLVENEWKASNFFFIKSLPWSVIVPALLAYLGVVGYSVAYLYLRAQYGVWLPGVAVRYPFVDTVAALLDFPFALLAPLVSGTIITVVLTSSDMSPDRRKAVVQAVEDLKTANLTVRAAEAEAKGLEATVDALLAAGPASEEGDADQRLCDGAECRRQAEAVRALIDSRREHLTRRRGDILQSAPFTWRWPVIVSTVAGKWSAWAVALGGLFGPFLVLLLPWWAIRSHDQYTITAASVIVTIAVAFLFVPVMIGYRTAGLALISRPPYRRAAQLVFVFVVAVFAVWAAGAVGRLHAYDTLVRHRFTSAEVRSPTNRVAAGYLVPVVGSETLYVLERFDAGQAVVQTFAPGEVARVTADESFGTEVLVSP